MGLELLALLYFLSGCNKVETRIVPCEEGKIETKDCGPNSSGTELRTCFEDKWSEWSECNSLDLCVNKPSFPLEFCDLNPRIVADVNECKEKIYFTLGCENGVYTVGLDRNYEDVSSEGEGEGEIIDVSSEGEGEGEIIDVSSEGEGEGEIIDVSSEGEGEGEIIDVSSELISPVDAVAKLPSLEGSKVSFIYRNGDSQHLIIRDLETGEVSDRLLDSDVGEVVALDLDGNASVFTDGLYSFIFSSEIGEVVRLYWGIGGQGVMGSVFDLKAFDGRAVLSGNFVTVNGLRNSSGFAVNDYREFVNSVSPIGVGMAPRDFDFENGKLAYVKVGSGKGLYLLNLFEGGEPIKLDESEFIRSPILNENGLAYLKGVGIQKKVYFVTLDGSEKRELFSDVDELYDFSGTDILFSKFVDGVRTYFKYDIQNESLVQFNFGDINCSSLYLRNENLICGDKIYDRIYSSKILNPR